MFGSATRPYECLQIGGRSSTTASVQDTTRSTQGTAADEEGGQSQPSSPNIGKKPPPRQTGRDTLCQTADLVNHDRPPVLMKWNGDLVTHCYRLRWRLPRR